MVEQAAGASSALIGLGRATAREFGADGCRALSAALVYYSTLSIVPLLIMLFTLPGIIFPLLTRRPAEQILELLAGLLGPNIGEVVTNALDRVQNQSLLVAAISIVMLFYSASSVFRFLRYAFRRIWRSEEHEVAEQPDGRLGKTMRRRTVDGLIAFGVVFISPLIIAAGLAIYAVALLARRLLLDIPLLGDTLASLIIPLGLLGIYAGIFLFLLWVMPPVRLGWREILPAGLSCAVAVLITTYSLGLYVRFFSAGSLYGAIGTLFALQIWTYANAIVLFSCAELSKLLFRARTVGAL